MSRHRNLDADLKASQQIEIHRQSKNIDDVNADATQSAAFLAILGKIEKSTFKFFSLSIYLSIYLSTYLSIYVIMKTMCSPGYHHNGFMSMHALGQMM